jgi:Uma2 family endonuclease
MPVSIEEYLTTRYEPACDYVDGELVDRNAGLHPHSLMLVELIYRLYRYKPVARVYPILRMQVSPTRIRVADICVVTGPRTKDQVLRTPPFICIEVLSDGDTFDNLRSKLNDYLRFGVSHVWLIDPVELRAWTYSGLDLIEVTSGTIRVDNPSIDLSLNELFAGLDR